MSVNDFFFRKPVIAPLSRVEDRSARKLGKTENNCVVKPAVAGVFVLFAFQVLDDAGDDVLGPGSPAGGLRLCWGAAGLCSQTQSVLGR